MGTPPAEHRYRFQWTFPVFYSRWEPRELWIAGNRIFRSVDDGQSWEIVSPDLTRNDPDEARAVGRAHHQRQYRRRGVLHDLRAGRVAARARRAVGGHRRRARPPLPRSRPDLAAGDAAGAARVGADQRARALAARRGHLLRGGHALQARRHAPLSLQDERLRAHLDADQRRPAGRASSRGWSARTRPGAGCSTAAPRPACGCRSTTAARGTRLRGNLPVAPIHDLDRQERRPRRGHPRALLLDPRRPLAAAPDGGGDRHRRRRTCSRRAGAVRWRAYRGHGMKPGPNREVAYSMAGLARLRLSPGGVADRARRKHGSSTRARTRPDGVIVHYWLREAPAGDVVLTFLDGDGREIRSFTSRKDKATPESPGAAAGGGEEPQPALDPPAPEKGDEPHPTKQRRRQSLRLEPAGARRDQAPRQQGPRRHARDAGGTPRAARDAIRCGSPSAAGRSRSRSRS